MASVAQKLPLARTLEAFGNRKAAGAIALLGKALPAKVEAVAGSIVTVSFPLTNVPFTLPNIKCPIAGPQWARAPTQVGDLGVVFPADTFLGGVTGLGTGTADLSQPGNLAALVFFPVGSTQFSATDNPNAWVLYGPDGVILRDSNSNTVLTITPGGAVLNLQAGDALRVNGNLIVTGTITAGQGGADQVGLQTHTHPANGQPPTPGT